MNTPNKKFSVGHAELYRGTQVSDKQLNRDSIEAVSPLVGQGPEAIDIGLFVADYVRAQEERQTDYHDSYRELFRVAERSSLIHPHGGLFGVQSLLDFDARIAENPEVLDSALPYTKGLSVELGSTLQLGDWEAGHELDEEMRVLPYSQRLTSAGFDFKRVFGEEREKHSYELRFFKDLGVRGMFLTGVRKRPIADIETDHAEYHLFKHSAFVVKAEPGEVAFDETDAPIVDQTLLGEKYLEHARRDRLSDSVTPISSKYLALIRSGQ